jgi:hypothetical protein
MATQKGTPIPTILQAHVEQLLITFMRTHDVHDVTPVVQLRKLSVTGDTHIITADVYIYCGHGVLFSGRIVDDVIQDVSTEYELAVDMPLLERWSVLTVKDPTQPLVMSHDGPIPWDITEWVSSLMLAEYLAGK